MKSIMKRALLAVSIMALLIIGVSAKDTVSAANAPTIAEGVYIGRTYVGGMTEEAAREKLVSAINVMRNENFILQATSTNMQLTGEEMEVSADIDSALTEAMAVAHYGSLISRYLQQADLQQESMTIAMPITINYSNVAQHIINNLDTLNINAVPNSITHYDGVFQVTEGTPGQEVNVQSSVTGILDFLENIYTPGNNVINLAVEYVEPKGDAEALRTIQDHLGGYHTNYSSSTEGRAQNVRNGASKINGTVLYPGETFSVYETVGPFTEENGYALAASYGAGTVEESFGGGICQVSTTLYNAAIRAELWITERYNHSMTVGYVDYSFDAAIASEWKDLKFVNIYDTPVYIEGFTYDGVLYFDIYGKETRPENRSISFESELLAKIDYSTVYEMDSSIPVGQYQIASKGFNGIDSCLWKIVYVDGVEESKEKFNTSQYELVDRKILIGTDGATSAQYNALLNATGTGSESYVLDVVNSIFYY